MPIEIIRKPGSILARILGIGAKVPPAKGLVVQEVSKPRAKRKGCNCRKGAK